MIVREIVATCSNPAVARAALASIGGDFERSFAQDAAKRDLSPGALASSLAHRFVSRAEDSDWDGVVAAVRGAQMPVLSGLRFLLERAMEIESDRCQQRRQAEKVRTHPGRISGAGCLASL